MVEAETLYTPDGCPVDAFVRMPHDGEGHQIHEWLGTARRVLELGAGVGRITRVLVECGHQVTAVDESMEMLANQADVPIVRARIQDLELNSTFDAILLASYIVNTSASLRRSFYRTCRRHVGPDGFVLIERMGKTLWNQLEPQSVEANGFRQTLQTVERKEDVITLYFVYEFDGRKVHHRAVNRFFTDEVFEQELKDEGLHVVEYLDRGRNWARVSPIV